jgi:hypothetical protein
VLELRLEQLLAAALGRAAAVGADGHQHDGVPGQHPADARCCTRAAQHPVAVAARLGQGLQLALGHAGVVLQLQGRQGRPIGGGGSHAADELAFGAAGRLARSLPLRVPMLQRLQRLKGLRVKADLQLQGLASAAADRGRNASSSPGCRGCRGLRIGG